MPMNSYFKLLENIYQEQEQNSTDAQNIRFNCGFVFFRRATFSYQSCPIEGWDSTREKRLFQQIILSIGP